MQALLAFKAGFWGPVSEALKVGIPHVGFWGAKFFSPQTESGSYTFPSSCVSPLKGVGFMLSLFLSFSYLFDMGFFAFTQ